MRRLVGWGLANETVGRVGHAEQSNAVSRLGGIQGMGADVRHAAGRRRPPPCKAPRRRAWARTCAARQGADAARRAGRQAGMGVRHADDIKTEDMDQALTPPPPPRRR